MVVQHNMQAMNANRMLNITTGSQAKSTEKLSSGYRINRAADDAAGLSISEKMRKQMRGLDRASTNAQDGVSAVQTAEGALTEVHSMLQRMNELATQAANGTNSETDRQSIQDEISQLTTEIDRVAETTKFNETYLLKGNPEGTSSEVKVAAHDAGLAGKLTTGTDGNASFKLDKALENGDKVTIAGKEYTIGTSGKGTVFDKSDLNTSTDGYKEASDDTTFKNASLSAGDSVTVGGNTYTVVDKIGLDDISWSDGDTVKVGDVTFTISSTNANADAVLNDAGTAGTIGTNKVKDYIKAAIADGKQVETTASGKASKAQTGAGATTLATLAAGITIVESLGKGEVSEFAAGGVGGAKAELAAKAGEGLGATTLSFAAGDSVTVSGKTTIATAEEPVSARETYDDIMDLEVNDTVKVGSGADAIEYTIVDEADVDESTFKVTKEMILANIQDGDTVDVDGNGAKTVIGDIGSTGTATDVISAKDAYKMMAAELQKASSIGADKAAEVTNNGDGKFTIKQGSVEVKDGLSFSLHVGADADMTNKITVDIDSMSSAGLGIKNLSVAGDDASAATYAVDAISDAIAKVSAQRSALGAVQNRLEHTIANVDNVVENTTSAESRIRDTDMASEMVEFSKNNILAQAGQSMLAQANQSNQGVLSLLG